MDYHHVIEAAGAISLGMVALSYLIRWFGDGPAAQAGLKPGDVVTAIGGVKISNTAQLLRAVGALKPPASAVLAVQRGSDAMTLAVPVARRPPAKARDVDDGR